MMVTLIFYSFYLLTKAPAQERRANHPAAWPPAVVCNYEKQEWMMVHHLHMIDAEM
tara:strand:- start:123 stop:290 length:168 start_codon:yes stop_codon:yes gene_type:complete